MTPIDLFGVIDRDDDIPLEVRRDLMRCAAGNGRISYYYLCAVWRHGRDISKVDAGAIARKVVAPEAVE